MANQSLKPLKELSFTDQPVLVSVAMIAYNVDNYIVEGIESILAQKVNFRVELLIGEDCSTDNTRDIVLKYQEEYPTIIKVLPHPKNIGLTPNFVETINACTGVWVALCDGDDFWTDNLKLDKQVRFLTHHPHHAGAAHQSFKIYTIQNRQPVLFGARVELDYEFEDMLSHRKFHTSSFIFKRQIWTRYNGIPINISSNERALFPLVALDGPIWYTPDNMCVYRITGTGLTSRVDYTELKTDLMMIPWIQGISPNTRIAKFRAFLHQCVYNYGSKPVPLGPLLTHYLAFVYFSFGYFPNNFGDIRWGTVFFLRRFRQLF